MGKYIAPGHDGNRRMALLTLTIVVLAGTSVWLASNRQVGPDPAQEALHSPQEALTLCQTAINSRFASQSPTLLGLGVEYLQGGEYEIRGTLTLRNGSRRIRNEVVCIAQFSATEGWDAEEISLEPS